VRGVNQAPAIVDRRVIEQPFDRPRVAYRQTILHFADLLGDMDVDRRTIQRMIRQHAAHRFLRHGAQRMQRDADAQ
jgi:hypothetical protein